MSDTSSSSSNASTDSDTFNRSELLDIIAILLLPKDAKVDLEITTWKDKDLIELLTLLFENYTLELCRTEYSALYDIILTLFGALFEKL